MTPTESLILMALQLFAGSNPTIAELETVLPQMLTALSSSKQGQAFSVSIPGKIDSVAGSFTFGFAPGA